MTIDFHSHWLPHDLTTALRQRGQPPCISGSHGNEKFVMPAGVIPFDMQFGDLADRIAFMDRHKIEMQVLSLPCLFGIDTCPANIALPLVQVFNDATAQACADHPGRFAGLAALPFGDMDLAVTEFRRARRELGLLGAIIPNNYFLSVEHVNALTPLLDVANRDGGHLFLHPGRREDEADAARFPDNSMPRRQLDIQHQVAQAMVTLLWGGIAEQYPNVTWHVANMGGTLPLVVERMDQTSRLRTHEPVLPSDRLRRTNVLVDCSSMGPVAITAAVACFGADSILFGSDHPIYRADEMLAAVEQASISESDKRAIRQGNARRILAA